MRLTDLDQNNPEFVRQAVAFSRKVLTAHPEAKLYSTTEMNVPDLDVYLTFVGITNQDLSDLNTEEFPDVMIDRDELLYRGVYADAFPELGDAELSSLEEVVL